MTRRTLGLVLVSGALVVNSVSCSRNRPPNLTPDATLAYTQGQILTALDLIRNTATIANSYNVAQFDVPFTRRVVQAHSSWLTIMDASKDGWNKTIQASLAELMKNVSPSWNRKLSPWAAAASLALNLIGSRDFDEVTSAAIIAKYHADLKDSLQADTDWLATHR